MAKHSLRSGAGVLEIDHRESPGLSWEDIPLKARLAGMIPVGKGERFEADAYQCTHCMKTIVLTARQDDMHKRGYCSKCDHYICNRCEKLRVATGFCWSIFRVLDRAFEVATKYVGDPTHPAAKIDLLTLREPPPITISMSSTKPSTAPLVFTDAWRTS